MRVSRTLWKSNKNMGFNVINIMRAWFKLALVFFGLMVLLALISIVLGTGLQYLSYQRLFNALAIAIIACVLVSVSLCITGICRERIRRYRYYLLIAGNLLFFIWVLLE
jgi:hypothetical protein